MERTRGLAVFVASLAAGIAGGSLGGCCGMAMGLNSSLFRLSPENFGAGLLMGAALGLFPAVVIALVSVGRYRKRPRRRIRLHAPIHAAVLSFLPVCVLMTCWISYISSC